MGDFMTIFAVLLIGHFLGDFYLQSESMARKKDADIKTIGRHGIIYTLALFAIASPLLFYYTAPPYRWLYMASIPLSHFIIDLAKLRLIGWEKLCKKNDKLVFFIDQTMHTLIILAVALIYATQTLVAYSPYALWIQAFYTTLNIGVTAEKSLQLICLFLFLGKPASIIIQNIIMIDDVREAKDTIILQKEQKAGRLIGIFERYLAVILVIVREYSALAFIVTAKSIARFNKISDDPEFAERYLLGTLGSILLAVAGAALYISI